MTKKELGARVLNKGKFVDDDARLKKEKMTRKRRRMVPVTRKG